MAEGGRDRCLVEEVKQPIDRRLPALFPFFTLQKRSGGGWDCRYARYGLYGCDMRREKLVYQVYRPFFLLGFDKKRLGAPVLD